MKALTNIFKECIQNELDKKKQSKKKRKSLDCQKNISAASQASKTTNTRFNSKNNITQSSILRRNNRGDGSSKSTISFSGHQTAPASALMNPYLSSESIMARNRISKNDKTKLNQYKSQFSQNNAHTSSLQNEIMTDVTSQEQFTNSRKFEYQQEMT